MSLKGVALELFYSEKFHSQYLPVLISPQFLRGMGAGQIDLAYIKQGQLYLCEIKSSLRLSFKQRRRLKKTACLLGEIFKMEIKLRLLVAK